MNSALNLDIPEWVDAFPNRILGGATVDRLRHGAYKVVLRREELPLHQATTKNTKTACQRAEKTNMKGGEKVHFKRPSEITFWALLNGSITAIIGGSIKVIIDSKGSLPIEKHRQESDKDWGDGVSL
jgi:hypothetical protein